MQVAFRTDASLDIGTGHVMRCLTLADALQARGATCRFVCRAHVGNLVNLITNRGHIVHSLLQGTTIPTKEGVKYAHWLGTDWATDMQETQLVLKDFGIDWLIVDHYAIDARWESCMRTICRRIAAIDDLADRPHNCDLLIDQNLGHTAAEYVHLVPSSSRVLVGPAYALLRPEFAELRERSVIRRQEPKIMRLLISLGGIDIDNITTNVLVALCSATLPDNCKITVVMGSQAPYLHQVRSMAEQMPWATQVCVDIQDMAQLMADCDLAIGAAGSTSWERCCLGVPTLLLVLADNQCSIANALQEVGAVIVLERDFLMDTLPVMLGRLIVSPNELLALSNAAARIIDGHGTSKVLAVLGE